MIRDYIPTGRENAITGREISQKAGITLREVTRQIHEERNQGAPICATTVERPRGYYLAGTKQEMIGYCRSLNHRAGEIHQVRRACLKAADSLPDGAEEEQPQ